jgi:tRNA threonylcarbamoyladenosine biosynthesis protein TsaB
MTEPQTIAYPLLLTDCSAPGVRAGILGERGWLAYVKLEGETGSQLFEAVKQLLAETKLQLEDFRSFVYCEGPGSTLGIRINSIALRTWTSMSPGTPTIYTYRSLVAAGMLIELDRKDENAFTILSDLRKNSWNVLRFGPETDSEEIRVVSAEELSEWPESRYFIQQRIHSPGTPPGAELIDYDLEALGSQPHLLASLRQVEKPEIFQTTTTEFKKWTPNRHR